MASSSIPSPSAQVLRQEIDKRLHLMNHKTKHHFLGQTKSELAVLLFEAHRTEAHKTWGYKHLGSYASEKAGINTKTFSKYKAAGKALFEYDPKLYCQLLQAIQDGSELPVLPPVSALAVPRRRSEEGEVDDNVKQVLHGRTHVSWVEQAAKDSRFGSADQAGQKVLATMDKLSLVSEELAQALTEMLGTKGWKSIPPELLAQRIEKLGIVFSNALDLAREMQRRMKGKW